MTTLYTVSKDFRILFLNSVNNFLKMTGKNSLTFVPSVLYKDKNT